MFNSDGAEITLGIHVQLCVLIKIASLRNRAVAKFYVEGVSVGEISNLHGLNPRSKNAL